MSTPKKPHHGFPAGQVIQMAGPFTARIEEVRGNTHYPVEIPGSKGKKFSAEDCQQLGSWLREAYGPGKEYEIALTDTKNDTVTYEIAIPNPPGVNTQSALPPPQVVHAQEMARAQAALGTPAAAPPGYMNTTQAATPALPQIPPGGYGATPLAGAPAPQTPYGYSPYGTPPGYMSPPQQPYPGAPAPGFGGNWMPWMGAGGMMPPYPVAQSWNMPPWGMPQPWNQSQTPHVDDARAREAERKLQEEREARLAAEHKAERERIENDYRQKNLEQQNAIKALYDRLEEMKAAKPGESDEIRRLREENDRRDREIREKEFRDELRRSEERTAALISELRNAANNNQPNMFAEAMKESARLSAETARETARVQAEATKENARVMQEAMRAMGPGQLLDVIKVARDQSGTFDLVKNITSAFGGMMDVQVTATKAALENLGAGQPSLGAQLAGEAINTVRGGIEKIVEMKGATSIQEERRKEMEARAAVETARAASIRAETERQMTTHLREAPAAPLGDPNSAGTAKVLRMVPTPSPEPEAPPAAAAPPPVIPVVDATRLLYPEEVETLGTEPQIHEAIRRLRVGTLDYLRATPEEQKAGQKVTGEPILTPDRATSAILQGLEMARASGVQIPARKLLLDQQYYPFMKAILPDAPISYIGACGALLQQKMDGAAPTMNGQNGVHTEEQEGEEEEETQPTA